MRCPRIRSQDHFQYRKCSIVHLCHILCVKDVNNLFRKWSRNQLKLGSFTICYTIVVPPSRMDYNFQKYLSISIKYLVSEDSYFNSHWSTSLKISTFLFHFTTFGIFWYVISERVCNETKILISAAWILTIIYPHS